jgi:DHA2 family multidrug resistance protein
MNNDPRSSAYRWAVLSLIMIGTFMAILDTSIVNVALPHMMSAFGVNRNQIEWVATGFMLATAVSMPLVGWLAPLSFSPWAPRRAPWRGRMTA